MDQKSGWKWFSVGLLCALILLSYLAVYYYSESARYQQLYNETLNELRKYDKFMFVNMIIDYGNGTKVWYNNTLVIRGADLLNATRTVAEVDYTRGQYGAFVTRINGMGQDPKTYWLWYTWNSTTSIWDFGPVASDMYTLHEGDIVAWIYTKS